MKRRHHVLALIAAMASASVSSLGGQTPDPMSSTPDFSGSWVLDGAANAGFESPFGSQFTASQTKDALTLDMVIVITYDPDGPVSMTHAGPPTRRVVTFNAETRETSPPPPAEVVPSYGMVGRSVPVSSVTRTGWQGLHLVITTHSLSRMSAPSQTPPVFDTRDFEQLTVSLVDRDQLVVETLRIADPDPWGADQYWPPEITSHLYRRAGTRWNRRDGRPGITARPVDGTRRERTASPVIVALRRRAANGDADAQFALGERYQQGNDVPRSSTRAVFWFRKAASQGDRLAQSALGEAYSGGQGVPRDEAQAIRWYRKAADQGLASAQVELGSRYEHGGGRSPDFKQAAFFYRKAAEQGYAPGQYFLARLYASSDPRHVEADYPQAAQWYRKAADQGVEDAMSSLASIYDRGQGVPRDSVEALKWRIVLDTVNLAERQHSERERMAKLLTGPQIAEAESRSTAWLAEYKKLLAQAPTR
jgi:TPR repeat protein